MSITSLTFLLFAFCLIIIYYVVPKKTQWIVLLIFSLYFYIVSSTWGIIFILITSLTTYLSTLWMTDVRKKHKNYIKENKQSLSSAEKKEIKTRANKTRRNIMVATLVLNFGILCVFKYAYFVVDQINGALSLFNVNLVNPDFDLIAVLGISFYTFQSMGYVVDVYWETVDVQRNYFKTLLFVLFFPQITQGPISDYSQLSAQLFKEHTFSYNNYWHGLQRMVWGIYKKLVIADFLAPCVANLFNNYNYYSSITCFIGIFMYSVQIYADFSGYMDIMCGICKTLGIELTENFDRPYFSKSIAEYWRRWHISLGTWFKKYIYYPIGASKWNRNLGKKASERFGKFAGNNLPASLALIAVWLTTGLWHGASWAYIVWGGVNGVFIIFSMWMDPLYAKFKNFLHIKENTFGWRAFQTIRTFVLVTFIKVLPEVGTLSKGLGLWRRILCDFAPLDSTKNMLPFVEDGLAFVCAFIGIILMFIVSMIQRKGSVVKITDKFPSFFVIIGLLILIVQIFVFGVANNGDGGFLYARF